MPSAVDGAGRAEAAIHLSKSASSAAEVPQLRIGGILGVWAAGALPMAVLAWIVAPALEGRFAGSGIVPMAKALIVCLTLGLVWQFVLVAILVGREQGTLRWSTVRESLWLRPPRSPHSGRVGGRLWLIVIPVVVVVAAVAELIPTLAAPEGRDLATLVANGVLFTGYHLHVPWVMPGTLVESLLLAYPTKRYRSAWFGIVAHSAQSVFLAILVLTLVI